MVWFGYLDVFGNLEWIGVWWDLSVGRVKYKPKYRWDLEIVLWAVQPGSLRGIFGRRADIVYKYDLWPRQDCHTASPDRPSGQRSWDIPCQLPWRAACEHNSPARRTFVTYQSTWWDRKYHFLVWYFHFEQNSKLVVKYQRVPAARQSEKSSSKLFLTWLFTAHTCRGVLPLALRAFISAP